MKIPFGVIAVVVYLLALGLAGPDDAQQYADENSHKDLCKYDRTEFCKK